MSKKSKTVDKKSLSKTKSNEKPVQTNEDVDCQYNLGWRFENLNDNKVENETKKIFEHTKSDEILNADISEIQEILKDYIYLQLNKTYTNSTELSEDNVFITFQEKLRDYKDWSRNKRKTFSKKNS
jgi:hypothetical protein